MQVVYNEGCLRGTAAAAAAALGRAGVVRQRRRRGGGDVRPAAGAPPTRVLTLAADGRHGGRALIVRYVTVL